MTTERDETEIARRLRAVELTADVPDDARRRAQERMASVFASSERVDGPLAAEGRNDMEVPAAAVSILADERADRRRRRRRTTWAVAAAVLAIALAGAVLARDDQQTDVAAGGRELPTASDVSVQPPDRYRTDLLGTPLTLDLTETFRVAIAEPGVVQIRIGAAPDAASFVIVRGDGPSAAAGLADRLRATPGIEIQTTRTQVDDVVALQINATLSDLEFADCAPGAPCVDPLDFGITSIARGQLWEVVEIDQGAFPPIFVVAVPDADDRYPIFPPTFVDGIDLDAPEPWP